MTTNESIERLRGNKDFVEWLDSVYQLREAAISSIVDVDREKIQQRAGAIVAYQAMLDTFQYGSIKRPWDNEVS
jgi:hypothetical protein